MTDTTPRRSHRDAIATAWADAIAFDRTTQAQAARIAEIEAAERGKDATPPEDRARNE